VATPAAKCLASCENERAALRNIYNYEETSSCDDTPAETKRIWKKREMYTSVTRPGGRGLLYIISTE
jgi:hypothetical protein